MKRFILGVLEIVVASLVVNWVISNWTTPVVQVPDLSYPTMTVRPTQIIPLPTATTIQITRIADGVEHVWPTIEAIEEYYNKDFSSVKKDKLIREHKPGWMVSGDEYQVLEQRFPYALIKITKTNPRYSLYDKISRFNTQGWIKA